MFLEAAANVSKGTGETIVDYLENFAINKVSKIYSKARYVIELPAGTIKNKKIEKNQKIFIENY